MKLKHQSPKGYRINRFSYITIKGDYAYCSSHNFVYNTELEKEKLYNNQACYYTDGRFVNNNNYSGEAVIFSKRFKDISLKSCIRRVLKVKGIPVTTIVKFSKSWYFPSKRVDLSYLFKIRQFKPFNVEYQINKPEYSDNFTNCDFSKQLTSKLRNEGFIVGIYKDNNNFISSMISTASVLTGKYVEPSKEDGEIAIAYGFGKKIGYSSQNNSFMGYSNGCDNVLWDSFGYFNKWSQCREITKTTDINTIVKWLKLSHVSE